MSITNQPSINAASVIDWFRAATTEEAKLYPKTGLGLGGKNC